MPGLARSHTVIAPDLPGHGRSDKPKGDYSLGAHACWLRDLLLALGHQHATLVGHSLGGGIAMQFSYQFPEMCERLVLVDSGGLGREVSVLLRAASLPGSEFVLPVLAASRLLDAGARIGGVLDRIGLRLGTDLEQMARGHNTLSDAASRSAFLHTLRGGRRPGRPARRRHQPPLPGRAAAAAADLGRARLDHPGLARPRRSRKAALEPARGARALRALPAARRARVLPGGAARLPRGDRAGEHRRAGGSVGTARAPAGGGLGVDSRIRRARADVGGDVDRVV